MNTIRPGLHSAKDLSLAAQYFITHEINKTIESQVQLMSAFQIIFNKHLQTCIESKSQIIEDEDFFNVCFMIFDVLFFNNKLEGKILVRFRPAKEFESNTLGRYLRPSTRKGNWPFGHYLGVIEIKLVEDHMAYPAQLSCFRRLTYYVEILLHEMVSAFFGVYTCRYKPACRALAVKQLGRNGHGDAWCALAETIQRATKQALGMELVLMANIKMVRGSLQAT